MNTQDYSLDLSWAQGVLDVFKSVEDKNKRASNSKNSKFVKTDLKWVDLPMKGGVPKLVRILPNLDNKTFGLIKYYHHLNGNNKVVCLRSFNLECPMCQLLNDPKYDKTLTKNFESRGKSYYNALEVGKESEGVKILTMSAYTYSYFLSLVTDVDQPSLRNMFHPIEGRNVKMTRKRDNGAWDIIPSFDPSPIMGGDLTKVSEVMDHRYDLPAIFKLKNGATEDILEGVRNEVKVLRDYLIAKMSEKIGGDLPSSSSSSSSSFQESKPSSTVSTDVNTLLSQSPLDRVKKDIENGKSQYMPCYSEFGKEGNNCDLCPFDPLCKDAQTKLKELTA